MILILLPESAFRFFHGVLLILIGAYFLGENGNISSVVHWAVGSLELGILRGTPPPRNLPWIRKVSVFKMYLLSNMVILGIHVSFRGCVLQVTGTCQFQRANKKH